MQNDDVIYRQAVIDTVNDIRDCISVDGYWALLQRLEKLPSAQPTINLKETIEIIDELIRARREWHDTERARIEINALDAARCEVLARAGIDEEEETQQ